MFYAPHARESGHVRSWKECTRDCSYDCATTLHRAVKVKPFLMADFPLVWCQCGVAVSAYFGKQNSKRAPDSSQGFTVQFCTGFRAEGKSANKSNRMQTCWGEYMQCAHFYPYFSNIFLTVSRLKWNIIVLSQPTRAVRGRLEALIGRGSNITIVCHGSLEGFCQSCGHGPN